MLNDIQEAETLQSIISLTANAETAIRQLRCSLQRPKQRGRTSHEADQIDRTLWFIRHALVRLIFEKTRYSATVVDRLEWAGCEVHELRREALPRKQWLATALLEYDPAAGRRGRSWLQGWQIKGTAATDAMLFYRKWVECQMIRHCAEAYGHSEDSMKMAIQISYRKQTKHSYWGVDKIWLESMVQIYHRMFVVQKHVTEYDYEELTDIFEGMMARTRDSKCSVCSSVQSHDCGDRMVRRLSNDAQPRSGRKQRNMELHVPMVSARSA